MRVAVWASGGDCPGMNAVVAELVDLAAASGDEIWGVYGGFEGLVEGRTRRLLPEETRPLRHLGGIRLGTSRSAVHASEPGLSQALQHWRDTGLGGAIVMGGDGTVRHGGQWMQAQGLRCVFVPATIDGDIPGTEYSLGFDSAANYAVEAAARLCETGGSMPGRVFILETLGGRSGHLALAVAEAVRADAVVLPEFPEPVARVVGRLADAVGAKGWALAVVAEGVIWDDSTWYAKLEASLPVRLRRTVLGHAQRAGAPTFRDLVWARRFAERAFAELTRGGGPSVQMVAASGEATLCVPGEALKGLASKRPDPAVYESLWKGTVPVRS